MSAPEGGRVDVWGAMNAADWYLAGYGSDDEYEQFQSTCDAFRELIAAAKALDAELPRADVNVKTYHARDELLAFRRALAACANGEDSNG